MDFNSSSDLFAAPASLADTPSTFGVAPTSHVEADRPSGAARRMTVVYQCSSGAPLWRVELYAESIDAAAQAAAYDARVRHSEMNSVATEPRVIAVIEEDTRR